MSDNRQIKIFDTTLRDGEQSPGASMNLVEKLEIAQALIDLGVNVIEAGFPIASPGDFEAVNKSPRTFVVLKSVAWRDPTSEISIELGRH